MSHNPPPGHLIYEEIRDAVDYRGLFHLAIRMLMFFDERPLIVCGGVGNDLASLDRYLADVESTAAELVARGEVVFSPAPFEERAFALRGRMRDGLGDKFLVEFYARLFNPPHFFREVVFLPNWRELPNGRMKHMLAVRGELPIRYLGGDSADS
jgi:hypothetical protein